MRDDCLNETVVVKEAIRRLPRKEYDERQFRISRALNLSCQKIVLPKEQWPSLDQDYQYLKPYIMEVLQEYKEQDEWFKGHKSA